MVEKQEIKRCIPSKLAVFASILTVVYLIINILGEREFGGSLAMNPSCYKYLGCTSGFLGYDAIEHFMFGVAGTTVLVYLLRKFPDHSILSNKRWKNFLMIVSIIVLISVLWEFVEFGHDTIRVDIFHQPLVNWKLNINYLDQPTNADTMGDMFFGLIGSILTLLFVKIKSLTE